MELFHNTINCYEWNTFLDYALDKEMNHGKKKYFD